MRTLLILLVFMVMVTPSNADDPAVVADPTDVDHVTPGIQLEQLLNRALGLAELKPRLLLPIAVELIKDFEKWKERHYNDASNYCTIGYGHLIDKLPCSQCEEKLAAFAEPLDPNIGDSLLDYDTGLARVVIQNRVHVALSDEQFGALTSFVFNVGGDNFSRSTMLKYLNNEEFDGAAREFPKWIKSKGQVLDGLISRRNCEIALFKGALKYRKDKSIDEDACRALGAAPSVENLIDIEVGESP